MGGSLVCYMAVPRLPGTLETCPDDFTCVNGSDHTMSGSTQYCSHACAIPSADNAGDCCQTYKCNGSGGSGRGSHHHHHH
nr:trypsin binding protein group 4 [synthetic construct]